MKRFRLPALLALTVVILYAPLGQYGYVHDDRVMIQNIVSSGMPDLSPIGKTFYRPLGSLYCYAVYTAFGANAVGFHVLALLLLLATALVVRLVARALTNDDGVAWGSAFLYAAAANIHLDAQMWMVGIFDNGAVFFALLCLYAFTRGQHHLSALWFACALGFKESAAPILLVLIAYTLLFRPPAKGPLRAWPHVVVAALWVAMKSLGASGAGLPDGDPYAWGLVGWHVVENVGRYITWFAPVPLATLVVIIMMGWACFRQPRTGWFLVAWALLMLVPPSILLHHAFRYYAILALPPIAIGMMVGFHEFPVAKEWRRRMAIVVVGATILANLFFIQGHVRRGINDDVPARDDGYNHLIRRSLQGQ
ncbi:MAG: hypothetical protein IPI01_03845 [Ignavibacteriae bacterium]|nr:hypothetical protein [Ignavibacteriota bacterium]